MGIVTTFLFTVTSGPAACYSFESITVTDGRMS